MFKRTAWHAILVGSLLCSVSLAGEADDAAAFRELQSKLKKALPGDWTLTVKLKSPYVERPTIVLHTKRKIAVEQIFPSSPGLPPSNPQKNPYLKSMVLEIELVTSPLITPKRHAELSKRNAKFRKQRVDFGAAHFKGMRWYNVKSGKRYSPSRLKPTNDEQRRRVLEYAFLWMRTEPVALPTHYYKSLSVTRRDEPFIMFPNKMDEDRFAKVSKAAESVLAEYPKLKAK